MKKHLSTFEELLSQQMGRWMRTNKYITENFRVVSWFIFYTRNDFKKSICNLILFLTLITSIQSQFLPSITEHFEPKIYDFKIFDKVFLVYVITRTKNDKEMMLCEVRRFIVVSVLEI